MQYFILEYFTVFHSQGEALDVIYGEIRGRANG